jgi:hypothetical protein
LAGTTNFNPRRTIGENCSSVFAISQGHFLGFCFVHLGLGLSSQSDCFGSLP